MDDNDSMQEPEGVMHVWTSPLGTTIPDTRSIARMAVGFPHGISSNSWRCWVKGQDTYVSCRDNFKELKVSLHASGIWRVALTEETLRARPELANSSGDRVIHRWKPDLDAGKVVVGFQVVILSAGLYLEPEQRLKWPKSINFVEPPQEHDHMTVLSVTVVPSTKYLVLPPGTRGIVLAVLPLGSDRTIQIVAAYEPDGVVRTLVRDAFNDSGPHSSSRSAENRCFLRTRSTQ